MERHKNITTHHSRYYSHDVRIIHNLLKVAIPVMFYLIMSQK
jgi:hypothetical protein